MNLSPATAREFPLASLGQALADFSTPGTAAIAAAVAFAGIAIAWRCRKNRPAAAAALILAFAPAVLWTSARSQLGDAYIADAYADPFGVVQRYSGDGGTPVRLMSGQLAVIPYQVPGAIAGDTLEIKATPRGRYLCRVGSIDCTRVSKNP